VQVETKKPEGAQQQAEAERLIEADDVVAAGLAIERQAEVDATFDAHQPVRAVVEVNENNEFVGIEKQ
jgi:hypothetical protein